MPAVLLPRTQPRKEQLIRAQKLAALGLAQCVTETDPETLRAAVEAALNSQDTAGGVPDLDGLDRVCGLVGEVLAGLKHPAGQAPAQELKLAAE